MYTHSKEEISHTRAYILHVNTLVTMPVHDSYIGPNFLMEVSTVRVGENLELEVYLGQCFMTLASVALAHCCSVIFAFESQFVKFISSCLH